MRAVGRVVAAALLAALSLAQEAIAQPAVPVVDMQALGVVPDGLKVAADGTDDAPSIQRALAQVCAGRTGVLRLLARHYTIASAIVQPCAVRWEGQGWQEPNVAGPGLGTWLVIAGPGFTPITVTGPAASGSVFQDFGVFQHHLAPGPNWAPTRHPYVFAVNDTNGAVTFSHLMMLAVDQGINANYAARVQIKDVQGQWFRNAARIERAYDVSVVDNLRAWPYWSPDAAVLQYQQANYDHLILGRVDDAFVDHIFALAARSVIKLIKTPINPAHPDTMPPGSPTNLSIGTVRGDFVKWTLWNTAVSTAFDDVSVSVGNLIHQGAVWGGLVPIPDNSAVRIDGSARLLAIGYLKADVLDTALIRGTNPDQASGIQVGRAMVIFRYSKAGVGYLLDPGGTASTLEFALPPAIDAGGNRVARQPAGARGGTRWVVPQ